MQELLEPLPVFRKVDGVGRGAKDRDALGFKRVGEFQRRLATELDDDAVKGAVRLFHPQDFEDVFQRQRFEVKPVGGVVIGADRFRVAVDHDGFIARIGQREAGVAAAIVELDPLADPVRAAAEDDDLFRIRRPRLTLHVAHRGDLIGGIHIGRLGLELRAAGVDALEDGGDAKAAAGAADLILIPAGQVGEPRVRKAHHLEAAQPVLGHRHAVFAEVVLHLHDLADTGEEPRVEGGGVLDLLIRQAVAHGLRDEAEAVRRLARDGLDDGGLFRRALDGDFIKAGQAGFHTGQRLLHRFVESAADGHRLTHRFHRGGEFRLRSGELLEGEAGDLGDDIVDGRLKARRGHLGDVVVQLIQRVADSELRGDLGDGEAGGLRGQRGRPRDARVHLDHDHAAVLRVDRPLNVRPAGFHPDLA